MAQRIMSEAAGQVLAGEIKDVRADLSGGWGIAKVGKVFLTSSQGAESPTIVIDINISDLGLSSKDDYYLFVNPIIKAGGSNWAFLYSYVFNYVESTKDVVRITFFKDRISESINPGFGLEYMIIAKGYGASRQ